MTLEPLAPADHPVQVMRCMLESTVRYSAPLSHAFRFTTRSMSKLLRAAAAGYGAKKLGGGCGCFGILIFIVLWLILGQFGIFQ